MIAPAAAQPEISVVIPVFNEAAILREAVTGLCSELDALPAPLSQYEIVLAENGSTDATPSLLRALSESNPRVRFLRENEPNYGRALKRGILEARGRLVICDEIDLCDVDFYRRALPLLEGGADLVVGSKAMRGARDGRPLVRRLATRVINALLWMATGFTGTDTHGLKAFRRDRLQDVARACHADRDLFASELVIRAGRMGRTVREIPIALREKRPPTINLLRRVPRVLRGLLHLGWTIRVRHR
jgi:glycosyltransferase involved in cell wall biosynthesis